MADVATYKQHDTLSAFVATLTGKVAPNDVVDLSALPLSSVRVLAKQNGGALFARSADSATALGVVTMQWQAGDLAAVGVISLEVEVTWAAGKVQTFPGNTYLYANVIADLDTPSTSSLDGGSASSTFTTTTDGGGSA